MVFVSVRQYFPLFPPEYYIIKKKHAFLSVRLSTFYIFRFFSNINIVNVKIIIEMGLNNCKEYN